MRAHVLALAVGLSCLQHAIGWQCALLPDGSRTRTRSRPAVAVDTREAATAWLDKTGWTDWWRQKLEGVVVPAASEHQIEGIIGSERCNVVLTHVNADFDSLAGAVALAKLWSIERPDLPTHVVMPRGVNPLVARFLAYHKHLLPIRGFKTIKKEDIAAVGVVDTQMKDRLGPAGAWLESAEHVAVVDHHLHASSDIGADDLLVESVGSATTVLVERLQALAEAGDKKAPSPRGSAAEGAPSADLTETEATLFALGIRTDTGALSFPATTTRDAYALAWLMGQGCSQSAIAEFGQTRLTAEQRSLLSTAMAELDTTWHEGLKIGSVVLNTGRDFVTGMAAVCEEVLQVLGCDVVLMGIMSVNPKGKATYSIIGRCSASATRRMVDLNDVLQLWGGGGHPAAAAASIKLSAIDTHHEPSHGKAAAAAAAASGGAGGKSKRKGKEEDEEAGAAALLRASLAEAEAAGRHADSVMAEAVAAVHAQIPEQVRAEAIMTKTVCSCRPHDSMAHVLALMNRMKRRAVPVMDETGTVLGFLKYRDPVKAVQDGKGQQQAKAWMRREMLTCGPSTTLAELEDMLIERRVAGRVHVVDEESHLLGLISRTDLLRQHNLYSSMSRRVA